MRIIRGVTYYDTADEALQAGVPFVLHVPLNAVKDEGGYVPSAVFENTRGHFPMLGQGEHAQPWYFGDTIERAQYLCDGYNERRGISKEEAKRIVDSSIFAGLVRP